MCLPRASRWPLAAATGCSAERFPPALRSPTLSRRLMELDLRSLAADLRPPPSDVTAACAAACFLSTSSMAAIRASLSFWALRWLS